MPLILAKVASRHAACRQRLRFLLFEFTEAFQGRRAVAGQRKEERGRADRDDEAGFRREQREPGGQSERGGEPVRASEDRGRKKERGRDEREIPTARGSFLRGQETRREQRDGREEREEVVDLLPAHEGKRDKYRARPDHAEPETLVARWRAAIRWGPRVR